MAKHQTILIVEDESTLRDVIRRYLELDSFKVLEAGSGPDALQILRAQPVELIVLDLMLPGLDGFAVARTIREDVGGGYLAVDGKIPIIILTSRGAEQDRLAGFELGVDDYVVKPFSPRELVARVKAVLRRADPDGQVGAEKPIRFPNLCIDPARRMVTAGDQTLNLTAKEFDLLWFFAQHPQQVFSRTQILDHVWGYEFYGDESTVTVHIRRLREKIEPDPANPTYVQTVWGMGYRFEGG